jgi:hypothetical protein
MLCSRDRSACFSPCAVDANVSRQATRRRRRRVALADGQRLETRGAAGFPRLGSRT